MTSLPRPRFVSRLAPVLPLALMAAPALAQSLLNTHSTLVARQSEAIPDAAGVLIPNLVFRTPGGVPAFDLPVIDENGNVAFLGRFLDTDGSASDPSSSAYFYGATRDYLISVIHDDDPAPGQAAGVFISPLPGTHSSLAATPRLAPDGRLLFAATLNDGGLTIGDPNDSALFGGFPGSLSTLVQKGDVALGTGGAQYDQNFFAAFPGIARGGRIHFFGALVEGSGMPPVVTTGSPNNWGLWAGVPGALELVARRGSHVSGLGGAVIDDPSGGFGPGTRMNDAGKVLYEVVLSQTLGSPAAVPSEDRALMIHSPGAGSLKFIREGDPAPGLANVQIGNAADDFWSPGIASSSAFQNNSAIFVTSLQGAISPGLDDRAVYSGTPGNLTLIARTGDPAPMTAGAQFDDLWTYGAQQNANGRVCLRASLRGPSVTHQNDSGIWTGMPGSLELVVREGQLMPGTGGGRVHTFVPFAESFFNDSGLVIFTCTLSGGTNPGPSLWAAGPNLGLTPVLLKGEVYEVLPGFFQTVDSYSFQKLDNSDGTAQCFGHNGKLALRLKFTNTTYAIVIVHVPPAEIQSFCLGGLEDDGQTPGCTPCPCGNNAPASSRGGCLNSSMASAVLEGSGAPLSESDSLRFEVTGALPTAFEILVSADNQLPNNGACPPGSGVQTIFDGLRCVGGAFQRHGARSTDANGSIGVTGNGWGPPDGPIDGIIESSGFSIGQVRHFQCIYRENPALSCGTGHNTTNAVSVTVF